MLRHFLTVNLRRLRKHWAYATLNVLGLAVGFAAFILIAIYVHHETSYENFHSRADRIYRATYRFQSAGEFGTHWARVPVDFINELPTDFPEVETLVRFQNHEPKYVQVGHEKFRPDHAYVADAEVFRVFDFPLVAGDSATALAAPHSMVLSQSLARKYFGEEDALGQDLIITGSFSDEGTAYTATGVMADLLSNTHLPVEMLLSFPNEEARTGWAYVYALLGEEASAYQVADRMPDFVLKYMGETDAQGVSFVFQPLRDIHLRSDLAREIVPGGSAFYVKESIRDFPRAGAFAGGRAAGDRLHGSAFERNPGRGAGAGGGGQRCPRPSPDDGHANCGSGIY